MFARRYFNDMKKFLTPLVAMCLVFVCAVSLTACKTTFEPAVFAISGIEPDEYGFAVLKGENADVLAKIDEVVTTLKANNNRQLNQLVNYYTKVYEGNTPSFCPVNIPDVTQNTGGNLVVGTETDFPIFEFKISSKGSTLGTVTSVSGDIITGLDIAIMTLVADKLNKKLVVYDIPFDSLPGALATNIQVIAAAYSITADREEIMDFSQPYYTTVQAILCSKKANLNSISKLSGKHIGVQRDTTGEELIESLIADKTLSGSTVMSYLRIANLYSDLQDGKIDAIVVDEVVAKTLAG